MFAPAWDTRRFLPTSNVHIIPPFEIQTFVLGRIMTADEPFVEELTELVTRLG
jgi:hypothetical protein